MPRHSSRTQTVRARARRTDSSRRSIAGTKPTPRPTHLARRVPVSRRTPLTPGVLKRHLGRFSRDSAPPRARNTTRTSALASQASGTRHGTRRPGYARPGCHLSCVGGGSPPPSLACRGLTGGRRRPGVGPPPPRAANRSPSTVARERGGGVNVNGWERVDPPGPVPEMPGLSPVKGRLPENGFTAVAQAEAGPSQYHKRKNS